MAKKITDRVTWVGKIDWELTSFHGDELSTHRGSSYNSYLIRDKKVALIDTVWLPYDREFVARLMEEIDLQKIDYIIMNHNEVDHSGALVELLRETAPPRAKPSSADTTIKTGTLFVSRLATPCHLARPRSPSSRHRCFTGPTRCSPT